MFEKHELQEFDKFYHRIVEGNGERELILFVEGKLYSFSIIALEIKARTKLARKLLDRVKQLRLI